MKMITPGGRTLVGGLATASELVIGSLLNSRSRGEGETIWLSSGVKNAEKRFLTKARPAFNAARREFLPRPGPLNALWPVLV